MQIELCSFTVHSLKTVGLFPAALFVLQWCKEGMQCLLFSNNTALEFHRQSVWGACNTWMHVAAMILFHVFHSENNNYLQIPSWSWAQLKMLKYFANRVRTNLYTSEIYRFFFAVPPFCFYMTNDSTLSLRQMQ